MVPTPAAFVAVRERVHWVRFASLVFEAAHATLLSAVLNRAANGNAVVYLTCIGGGVFCNDRQWFATAIQRAFDVCRDAPLDVRIVRREPPDLDLLDIVENLGVRSLRAVPCQRISVNSTYSQIFSI